MNAITGTMATVRRADLAGALALVSKVVERRSTIPILAHVCLIGDADRIALRATNMDMEASTFVPARGADGLSCTVEAATLRDIVKALGDDELSIRAGEDGVHVKAGSYSARMIGLPVDDFPTMHQTDWPFSFEVATDALRGLISRVKHAVPTEETRYYPNGIYLHVIDGRLIAAATDGHRLAEVSCAAPKEATSIPASILPGRTLPMLLAMLGSGSVPLRIEMTASGLRHRFTNSRLTLVSKAIDGTYPDYARLFPKDEPRLAVVKPGDMARVVKRVALMSADRSRPVRLDFMGSQIRVQSRSPEMGEAVDSIRMDGASGKEVGFNSGYLLDTLASIGGDVLIRGASGHEPVMFTDEADPHSRFVIMPMRV